MPKYWVKKYFTHGKFPEVGQKQKTEKKKEERKKEERKLVITMAMLCMAHVSTHGARKPPGPIIYSNQTETNLNADHKQPQSVPATIV